MSFGRSILVLATLCFASPARADAGPPDAYDCKQGSPNLGKGCHCPQGQVSARKPGNIAVCVTAIYEVTIDSRPSEAIVRIGAETHVTPFKLKVKAGSIDVAAEKDGYLPQARTLQITKNASFTIDLQPRPDPKLKVLGDANVTDADVSIDGVARGRVPLTIELAPGRHQAAVTKKGFEPFTTWFEVSTANPIWTLTVALKAVPRIKIEGDVNATGADVMLDGKPAGKAPVVLDTTVGRHYVHVSKSGFEEWHSGWFEIASEQLKTLAVALKPIPAAPPKPTCPGDMVSVPAGIFWMGRNGNPDQRKVSLETFCIDKTEVTVKAYQACVATGECQPAPDGISDPEITEVAWRQKWRSSCNVNRTDRTEHPINCIDWEQARRYCTAMNKRLPTEAEWEYAARGRDGREFPWGKDVPTTKLANVCDGSCEKFFDRIHEAWTSMYPDNDGWETTAPVGSFASGASPFGALDMAGNVDEWTNDWYAKPTIRDLDVNPKGPNSGTARVTKGGNWQAMDRDYSVQAWIRGEAKPSTRMPTLGFRCAK
jgi:formylglycine-generating enzyme required for sulfatase activity